MSEKQEKAWVAMRRGNMSPSRPVKVFDDRQDARDHVKRLRLRSRLYTYSVVGVKRG